MAHVGENIRAARQKVGMTADQLAARAKVTTNHMYVIERGDKEPRLDTLKRIARALKRTLDQLTA
jgi:transcriptional regulator with XRE-family HTH domain